MFQVLESSKRNLSEERPQSVIAELAPALLGDDVAASRALRSDRKTFLDALQMLQVRFTAFFFNIMLTTIIDPAWEPALCVYSSMLMDEAMDPYQFVLDSCIW